MAKTVLFAAALLLLGALAGHSAARYSASRHQHTRAVMQLGQFHFDQLSAAAKSGQCIVVAQQRERLLGVYQELIDAFPKTYAQDAQFRHRADDLRDALQPATTALDCGGAALQVKNIDNACSACHHDYR